ncbi:MAG: ABC transporter ATP-binding protein [Synergistaceae bacterium]|nr:ABC transporter ATP-binding protein [Synergistota bacterium]NLM70475.1 ABC transporter ATP-binding protein [Synergistaceae bacterium]
MKGVNLTRSGVPGRAAVSLAGEWLFRARGITKVYNPGTEAEVRALDGVDLDLFQGELAVLLGASGSGKSTLLNIIGGLDTPTGGTLFFRDLELSGADERDLTLFRRRVTGFVFQWYNLIPSLTARENVALVTEISDDPMTPEEALDLVDLSDRLDHFPSQLSAGQQQRVAIARAIAKRPEVLLCDEPTGALDVTTGITVLEAVEKVNRELGTLVLLITHNSVISRMAGRVISLSAGRIQSITENESREPACSLSW